MRLFGDEGVKWLYDKFNQINSKYFYGKLDNEVKIKAVNIKNKWGEYVPNGDFDRFSRIVTRLNGPGVIKINNTYDRSEKEFTEILIHEMIHMYIITIMKIYPLTEHDKNFKKIAARFTADGYDVSEKGERMGPKERRNKKNNNYYYYNRNNNNNGNNATSNANSSSTNNNVYYLGVINQPGGIDKFWGFRVDRQENVNYYIETARTLKQHVGSTKFDLYETNCECINKLKYSSSTLSGFGGRSIVDILYKISKSTNDDIEYSQLNLIQSYNL